MTKTPVRAMSEVKQSRRDVLFLLGSAAALSLVPSVVLAENAATPRLTDEDASAARSAAEALIGRVVPAFAHKFSVEIITPENDSDVFEIESHNGRIVLRGNHGVSVA